MHELGQAMPDILNMTGPVFICLNVEKGKAYPRDYVKIHSDEIRKNFRSALKQRFDSK